MRRFLAGAVLIAGCSGDQPLAVTPVASVEISPLTASILEGTNRQLTVVVRDASGQPLTNRTVSWTSSASNVATVSAAGLVTAMLPGTATIRASSETRTAEATITVLPALATVRITPDAPTIVPFETRQLVVTLLDALGHPVTGRDVLWSSSASTVATISSEGLLTGVAPGTATITATSELKTGTATVTVALAPVATVTLAPPAPALKVGESLPLTVTLEDQGGRVLGGRAVTWGTSDALIATVSISGVVSGVAAGSATVTATSETVSGTALVTVTPLPSGPPDPVPSQLRILDLPDLPTEGITFPSPVRVEIEDATGARVTSAQNPVTLSLGTNNVGGVLSGPATVSAVNGVATFTGLSLDKAGRYSLTASSGALTPGVGDGFNVTLRFIAISPNDQQTCGVTFSARVYCWGFNLFGQLGDGTWNNSRMFPAPIKNPGNAPFADVSLGLSSFTCARTTAGQAYCWGYGADDELGVDNTFLRTLPSLIGLPPGAQVTGISAGVSHACALVADGGAYCWGNNVPQPTAVTQPSGVRFVTVGAGGNASCALDDQGGAWCWGGNGEGLVGDGTAIDRPSPVRVLTPPGVSFVSLSIRGFHACGLTGAGAAWCWGRNDRGQLGDGTESLRRVPTPVQAPPGVTFAMVSTGVDYTCAIATGGDSWCWGNNAGNMLGDGTGNHRVLPVRVLTPPGVTFAGISSGFSHTCALTAIGSVYCWGQNGFGELGNGQTQLSTVPVRMVR